jgi:hypothetical protein
MSDDIPSNLISEIYAIDELNNSTNFDFPLAMSLIKEEQDKDDKIQETLQKHATNDRLGTMTFGKISVHTIDKESIVPTSLQRRIIEWYHSNLRHPGVTRTINSISKTFYWKGIRPQVEDHIKTCNECQRHKIVGKPHYGILPLVLALHDKKPFEKIQLDCAGPWTLDCSGQRWTNDKEYQIPNPYSHNGRRMHQLDRSSANPHSLLQSCCNPIRHQLICRYPRPTEVGYDNGKEYIG